MVRYMSMRTVISVVSDEECGMSYDYLSFCRHHCVQNVILMWCKIPTIEYHIIQADIYYK